MPTAPPSPAAGTLAVGFSATVSLTSGTVTVNTPVTLSGGTITGAGDLILTSTAPLTWSSGTMSGSGTTVAQGGLTLVSDPNWYTALYLDQRTLDNRGAAVFLASTGGYNSALYLSSGAILDNQAAGSFDFQGDNLLVEGIGGTPSGGTFDNEGALTKSAGTGTSSFQPGVVFNDNGTTSVTVASGTLSLNGSVSLDAAVAIASAPSATLLLSGGVTGTTRNADLFKPLGSLMIQGPGSAVSPELLEVMSQDLGNDLAGFQGNFHYSAITVASGALTSGSSTGLTTRRAAPAPGGSMSTRWPFARRDLDLNELAVYTRESQVTGTVINGTLKQVVSGGPIAFGEAVPGTIATAGQVDSWTFSGRAGTRVTVELTPATPRRQQLLIPYLEFARVSLLDPNNNLLATANDASPGDLLTLPDVSLPVDGVYTIQTAASLPEGTGHYLVSAYSAVITSETTTFDQVIHGALGSSTSTTTRSRPRPTSRSGSTCWPRPTPPSSLASPHPMAQSSSCTRRPALG